MSQTIHFVLRCFCRCSTIEYYGRLLTSAVLVVVAGYVRVHCVFVCCIKEGLRVIALVWGCAGKGKREKERGEGWRWRCARRWSA